MSTVYLSENANQILQDYLRSKGHNLIFVHNTGQVYPEVASHADIYMCKLGGQPSSPIFSILNQEENDLGYKYPENIRYNGVCMGQYFIHNLNHTSSALLNAVNNLKLNTIHVKQGYTKCNMVVLNDCAAITADEGILRQINHFLADKKNQKQKTETAMEKEKSKELEILLITPGHVFLEGFPYGFLGGSSGRIGDEIVFNGNLEAHPDFERIRDFVAFHGLTLVYFKEYPLTDIGSIIEEFYSPLDK